MGFWSRLADMILGYDVIEVEKAKELAAAAIEKCDLDGNGMLNGREVIRTIKSVLKSFWD